MKSLAFHCQITRLDSDADWQRHGPRLERIQSQCPPSLWLNLGFFRAMLALIPEPPACWLVEISDSPEAAPFAAAVFREETFRRSLLKPRVLRPFEDVFLMVIPFFLAVPGREEDAFEGMAQAVTPLSRASRSDIIMLRRVHGERAALWSARLMKKGLRPHIRSATPMPHLVIPDDFDAFLSKEHGAEVRDMQKQRRRIKNRYKVEFQVERLNTSALDDAAYARAVERFAAVRATTWQYKWEAESKRVDHHRQQASYRAAFDLWRQRGVLDFFFLSIAGKDAAFLVAVRDTDRAWGLLTGFDPEFRSYSVGKIAFIEGMRALHADGFRRFEMGGEVIGWKAAWATGMDEVVSMSFSTGTWRGRLWSLKQILRPPRASAQPPGSAPSAGPAPAG